MDAEGAVQAPFRVYDPTLFSRPSPSAGGLLRGGKFAWAFFPSGLLSVYSSGGECVSHVKLVPSQRKGRRLEVSCSCELSLSSFPTRSRSLPLALAVSVEGVRAKTTLVIVDALSSSLLRAIEVPWTVSSLCGVSEEAVRAVTSGLFSSSILREFSGVLAAGCAGGHVILVDLALGVIPVGAGSLAKPLQLVFVDSSQMGGGAVVSSTRSDGTSLACIDVLGKSLGCVFVCVACMWLVLMVFVTHTPHPHTPHPHTHTPHTHSLPPREGAVPLPLIQPFLNSENLPHRLTRYHCSSFRPTNSLSPHRLQHGVIPDIRCRKNGDRSRESPPQGPSPSNPFRVPRTGE